MGGCYSTAASKQIPNASTISPEKLSVSDSSNKYTAGVKATPEKTEDYIGFYANLNLLCLDEFVSRYTGEMMHRWRPATIVYFEEESGQVKVHFDGQYSQI